MENEINQLSDIDRILNQELTNVVLDSEEITRLVDKRDQILQQLIDYASKNERFAKSTMWADAISSTQKLVELMNSQTMKVGEDLRKFRIGQKSVQLYQKY
ncbi:flagellar protein FliT [Vibrio sp. RC27]